MVLVGYPTGCPAENTQNTFACKSPLYGRENWLHFRIVRILKCLKVLLIKHKFKQIKANNIDTFLGHPVVPELVEFSKLLILLLAQLMVKTSEDQRLQ